MLKRKPVSIDTLAVRLSDADANKAIAIEEAERAHQAERDSVLEVAVQRAQDLRRLEAEASADAEKAEAVAAKARS